MQKQILGLVGSPRRNGNTDVLVRKILEGAESEGAGVEIIYLDDFGIQECNGCHACWKTGQCVKKDGMREIYPKIIQSDIIIFGTPVYWYGPTALMKGLIDRFVYFNCSENRSKIKDKSAVLVIPYEETEPETAAPVIAFFEKSLTYLDINLVEKMVIPGVTLKGEVLKHSEIIDEAIQLGARMVKNTSVE